MNNKACYILVYANYKVFSLLEIGDREFILQKYLYYTKGVQEFQNKYASHLNGEWIKEMYSNPFSQYQDMGKFCIQGYTTCYKDGKLGCVCENFGINDCTNTHLY